MNLGIFAKTFPRPTLEETLDAVVAQSLTHIQFNMSCLGLATLPDRLDEGSCVWIARSVAERGLTMAAISGTFNMCDPSESRVQNNLRRLEVLAAACRWLDTRIITLCTGTLHPEDMWRWHPDNVRRSTWERLIQTTREAVKIADRHEVTLAFEPEINNVVNTVGKARKLLDEIGSQYLKVVIDPANLFHPGDMRLRTEILAEAFDWLGPEIVLAHAKEPRIDDKEDETELKEESTDRWSQWQSKLMVRQLIQQAAEKTAQNPFEKPVSRFPSMKVLREPAFFFYYPYFLWLKKVKYSGAIVIHGLDEREVEPRVSFLRKILELPFTEELIDVFL